MENVLEYSLSIQSVYVVVNAHILKPKMLLIEGSASNDNSEATIFI